MQLGHIVDENESYSELQTIWEEELRAKQEKRAHLIKIEQTIANHQNISLLPENVQHSIAEFKSNVEKPHFWINQNLTEDFTYCSDESTKKLTTWLDSYPLYNDKSKTAVSGLVIWYLNFIESKSSALGELQVGEDGEDLLEPLIYVSSIMETESDPLACSTSLREDFPYHFEADKGSPIIENFPEPSELNIEPLQNINDGYVDSKPQAKICLKNK